MDTELRVRKGSTRTEGNGKRGKGKKWLDECREGREEGIERS